jgi:hypothetical protein
MMRRSLTPLLVLVSLAVPRLAEARKVWIGEPRVESGHLVFPLITDDFNGIVAGDIDLRFDAARATIATVRTTGLLTGFALDSNPVGNVLKIAFASARPTNGSGVFLEIVVEEPSAVPQFGFAMVSLFYSNGDEAQVEYEMGVTAVTLDRTPPGVPSSGVADLRAYPNPFNADVRVAFRVAVAGAVRLEVFNLAGQRVRLLAEGERAAGVHEVVWDGLDDGGMELGSGIYLIRYRGPERVQCGRLALLR